MAFAPSRAPKPTVSRAVEGRAEIPGRAGLKRGLRRVVEGPRRVGIAQRPRPVGGLECREDERPGWGGAGTAVLAAAGERAPSQRSHVGRERRVAAASAQAILLQCGFQGAPPTSLQS